MKSVNCKIIYFGAALLMFLAALFYLFSSYRELSPERIDSSKLPQTVSADAFVFDFDEVSEGDHINEIRGYFVKRGVPTQNISLDVHMLVHDIKSDEWYTLPTEIVSRKKTTKLVNDGNDYRWSGIVTRWNNGSVAKHIDENEWEFYVQYGINDANELVRVWTNG